MANAMIALHEMLDLPAEVKKSDFVVRLTDGVAHPETLLRDYALTPDLLGAFDRALTLAGAAIRDRQSVAAYIHGSFGSGKSHFMAALSLMLGNDAAPWALPELHALRAKHEWVKEKKLLRLHFHMVGARSLEEKVFSEYLARVQERHPDAPIPALHEDEALFHNAEDLRKTLGDTPFFEKLNQGVSAKGWGKLGAVAAWTPQTFAAARGSSNLEERARLYASLVRTHFPAFASQTSGFVGFDQGLGVLARHAKQLGYDGVVLFLDELILWLASRAADQTWLSNEGQKLAKLVEAQDDRRDVPLISYVARQRDITEMVGDQYAGRDAQNLNDSLKWWEGRFDTLKLEDRSLPTIVQKRVVRAKDAAARKKLDDAFVEMRRTLGPSWGTLLGDSGDEAGFRQVYPFSPALIEALVALSNFLQRERTALKVLMELLVDHLKDFELGKVVPVGDLFDVLAGGEEPMDGAMKERFAAAKRLYLAELLPVIQQRNGTTGKDRCQRMRDDHPPAIGCSNCREARCRADNRLAKTLLLGSLIQGEKSVLRDLSVTKLVQLNHGTLKSPIPGAEASNTLARLRDWANEVSKLRIGDEEDPRISVALDTIDLKPVIEGARMHDSPGARRRKVQELLFGALEVDAGETQVEHEVTWRGSRRNGRIIYGNVREMTDDLLACTQGEDFRVVIDYPFDDAGHSPQEDEARLHSFTEAGKQADTVAWLPNFLSDRVIRDLGDLVVIDRLLEGDNWRAPLQHLRPEDQARARSELEAWRIQKRNRILKALEGAYGLRKPDEGEIDPSRTAERPFRVLRDDADIAAVAVTRFSEAVSAIVGQLLEKRYPRHPRFQDKITRARLEKAHELFRRIVEADGQRLQVDKGEKADLDPAVELGLVQISDLTARLYGERLTDLEKKLRADGKEEPTVAEVKQRIDPVKAMGLVPEVSDFVVMCFATSTARELVRGGAPLAEKAVLGKLPPDAELRKPALPDATKWEAALGHAGKLFGIALGGKALNPKNLRAFYDRIAEKRRIAKADQADRIAERLAVQSQFYEGEPKRLVTARKVTALLTAIDTENPVELVESLGAWSPSPSSSEAVLRHLGTARATADVLADEVLFGNFVALRNRPGGDAGILAELKRALEGDALNEDLPARVRALAKQAQALLHSATGSPQPPEPTPPAGSSVVDSGSGETLAGLDADRSRMERAIAEAGSSGRVTWTWRVTKG